jgi:hypothetical protein
MKKTVLLLLIIPYQLVLAQNVISPIDIARMEYVSSATINDEGSKVAYTVVKQADPLIENASASLKLWLYDVASKTSTPFITQGSLRGGLSDRGTAPSPFLPKGWGFRNQPL